MKSLLIAFLVSMFGFTISGQSDTIRLRKPSFEQKPQAGINMQTSIRGWYDCGIIYFPTESPPDIHPVDFWENTKQAQDGKTYLGMVTRDNESYESVSQKLPSKMISGECYDFSLYLSRSERYLSASRLRDDDVKVNYTNPIVLRIWGGFGYCDTRELLGETVVIDHSEWKKYDFKFRPKSNIGSITLEAFYKVPAVIPYNGHVLVDNLSDIVKIDCEVPEEIAVVEEVINIPPHKRRKKETKPKPKPEVEDSHEVIAVSPKPKKILKDLDRDKIREGQTIEIQNLYFKADTTAINADSYVVLDEVFDFLAQHRDVKVEIGGHTNGIPKHDYCDKLSTSRAKAVAEYLVKKGITPSRLTFKGYGKRKPVANNFTKEGRKKNQRVEIKITSLG